MWVLVLMYSGVAMTTIPGSYSTEEKCKEAAVVWMETGKFLAPRLAMCLPAPDDLYE